MPRISSKKIVKQPPLLYEKSQKVISKIQNIVGTKLLSYWTSNRGNVCDNDVIALYELFKKVGGGEEIAFFIKSGGGEVEPSLRMVNLIREYYKRVVALVPMECASAATMIAVGADVIKMGPLAHLTAIDSSLTHAMSPVEPLENRKVSVSQDELSRIVKLWNDNRKPQDVNPYSEIFKYIHPLVVGAIDRSSSLSIKICKEILSYHIKDEDAAERVSRHLNSDYPSHSYPITIREARRIGLRVAKLENNVNDLLLDLNEIYSEMAQKALTDFDELNYHDNEIINILEAKDIQIYYQNDKDWNYIKEERRWQALNDESSWRRIETLDGKQKKSQFHVR